MFNKNKNGGVTEKNQQHNYDTLSTNHECLKI